MRKINIGFNLITGQCNAKGVTYAEPRIDKFAERE